MLIAIQSLPGRSPCSFPSGSILVCDLWSSSAAVTDASAGMLVLPGNVRSVNASKSEPARLNTRGGVLLTTFPPSSVPSGNTTCESNRTGSTRRAWKESPGRLSEALTPPRRIIFAIVPAASVTGPGNAKPSPDAAGFAASKSRMGRHFYHRRSRVQHWSIESDLRREATQRWLRWTEPPRGQPRETSSS
jgi:hypothetical protein